MKTLSALAFALLAVIAITAAPAPAPAPAGTAPELALPSPAPAAPTGIGTPAPLPQLSTCFTHCLEIRDECDAGCSTTQCHRECRDSAVQCTSNC